MIHDIKRRLGAGFAAFVLVFGNVLLPVQPAFANNGNGAGNGGGNGQAQGDQAVWCQLTGNGWTAQLGGNNQNRYALTQLPAGASSDLYFVGGQVYAPNSSDPVLKGQLDAYCAQQYTLEIPTNLGVNDPCGVGNATWMVPVDTELLDWEVDASGVLTVEIIAGGYVFTDGTYLHSYGVATETNVDECEPIEEPLPPVPAVTDPCNLNGPNAAWIVPADTDEVTWTLQTNGELVASTTDGYVFTNGETSHNYGLPTDSGITCVTPGKIEIVDECGVLNDSYIVPTTTGIEYVVNGTVTPAGTYQVAEGASVEFTAQAMTDYEMVGSLNENYTYTDERCEPAADIDITTVCATNLGVSRVIIANTTDSAQLYIVELENTDGVVVESGEFVLGTGQQAEEVVFLSNGTYTISVYSSDGEELGELLASQTFTVTCLYTPEIYKVDQNGTVLDDGLFDVAVCYDGLRVDVAVSDQKRTGQGEDEKNCAEYTDVVFPTDGSWFADTVEYQPDLRETVLTISESEAPAGCTASGPWTYEWRYDPTVLDYLRNNDFDRLFEYDGELGGWTHGSNVMRLENDCRPEIPVLGTSTDRPAQVVAEEEVILAQTGMSQFAVTAVAGMMVLGSVLYLLPRLRRS